VAEILKNVRLYNGGADLTGTGNKLEAAAEGEEKDVTTWASYDPATDTVWKEVQLGEKSAKITGSGFWTAGDPSKVDDNQWALLGGLSSWSALPKGSAVGQPAWLASVLEGNYQLLGSHGDIAPWSASWSTSSPLVRGLVAHPPGTARTATGTGTAVQHVAVPAGAELVAALHVLSVAGGPTPPVITVKLQSDDTTAMTTPLDRVTFNQFGGPGGEARRVLGANTDTWYRASWTITGDAPSFLFLLTFGVA
jgi:hypothetical protein